MSEEKVIRPLPSEAVQALLSKYDLATDRMVAISAESPLPTNQSEPLDPMLEIARGNIPNVSHINKFGRNSAIALGTTEDIWDGSALYSFPTTALMTRLSQTVDQVAMRGVPIEITGLNASWVEVVQTPALDSSNTTTPIVLDPPLLRCYRMRVLGNVISTSPIRVHNTAEDQDYAIIGTGNNQTLMAIYTVPAESVGYMTQFEATVNPATNQDPTSMQIEIWARDNHNVYAPQLKHTVGLITGSHHHPFLPYKKFTQKTDIWMSASPVGKAADVSAGFDIIVNG